MDAKYINSIRETRIRTLLGVWDYLLDRQLIKDADYKLSIPIINELVEHYLIDLKFIKERYKIENKIQAPKVAGLLTALIIRYRPVQFLGSKYELKLQMYVNEFFAVFHGLSICSAFSKPKRIIELTDETWFWRWLNDFVYLLHCRNHTPESLSFVFETLSLSKFPEAIEVATGE